MLKIYIGIQKEEEDGAEFCKNMQILIMDEGIDNISLKENILDSKEIIFIKKSKKSFPRIIEDIE